MPNIIELNKVSFRYKNSPEPVLQNICLSVKKGECVVIQGASGSGKTSLCYLLNGLIPQVVEGKLTGQILNCGRKTSKFRVQTLARNTGMILQEPEVQIVGRTVYEDLAFGLRNYLVPKAEIEKEIPDTLRLVGLKDFEHRKSDELSGGEKQRLAIAGILITKPDILVLDEPTSELDPNGRQTIYGLFRELQEKNNLTIILIERNIDDITKLIDRVVFLNNGKIKWNKRKENLPYRQTSPDQSEIKFSPDFLTTNSTSSDILVSKRLEPQSIFELKNLNFAYNSETLVLKNINLTIKTNEYLAIIGHNGAGKSSLAKHLSGLIKPKFNQVFFKGRDITTINRKKHAQSVGLVFQNPDHQLFESSVEKEIAFGLKNVGLAKTEIKTRVQQILTTAELIDVRKTHPFALGKGSRQLIAIASVMALNPKVLIIDEPTTGLDESGIAKVMRLLAKLHRNGLTIILVSHDMPLIKAHSKRILVMQKGKIVTDKTTSKFFNKTNDNSNI